jgi:hypothetical protein
MQLPVGLFGEGGLKINHLNSTPNRIESFNNDIEIVPTSEEAKGMGGMGLFDSEYTETNYSLTYDPNLVIVMADSLLYFFEVTRVTKYLKDGIMRNLMEGREVPTLELGRSRLTEHYVP